MPKACPYGSLAHLPSQKRFCAETAFCGFCDTPSPSVLGGNSFVIFHDFSPFLNYISQIKSNMKFISPKFIFKKMAEIFGSIKLLL